MGDDELGVDDDRGLPPVAPPPAPATNAHVDIAGAVLLVVGFLGVAAWAWTVVRSQIDFGGRSVLAIDATRGSASDRVDVFANQLPVLLFAALVGGLGAGLRSLASTSTGEPLRSVLGRDDGGDEVAGEGDEPVRDLEPAPDRERDLPTTTTGPSVPTHTLEVHTDGCGVIRSGEIGDDLTWVVKDQDGFQVLGRSAAGETRYRYFQPGRYTVVLEAWAGGHYAEVSNIVTITC